MSSKKLLASAAGAGGAPSDPNFKQTVLLLHGDGNQGANNLYNPGPTKYLAFSDNSNNNFPITVNGDAYGTTNSPYEASYSNVFEASSGLTVPAQQFPGDFTWELWYYPTALGSGTTPNYSVVIGCGDTAIQNIQVYVQEDGTVSYYNGSTGLINSAAGIVAAGQWYHIALVRSGSTTTLYVNGVSRGSGTDSGTKNIVSIGCFLPLNAKYNVRGYLSNVRTTTTAVYTSAFTPPTAPLTAISGTSLLLCQANRFADNSASPKTVTVTGNVTVSPFQPFTLAANDYGAGYFDGTGDFLVTGTGSVIVGTGNFLMDCWVYPLDSGDDIIIDTRGGSNTNKPSLGRVSGLLTYQTSGANRINAGAVPANVWSHVRFIRNSGVVYGYVNGVNVGTTYNDTSDYGTITRFMLGADDDGSPNAFFNGYISDARFVLTTESTSNFTPPTAPVTNITNTQLLTCQYSGSVRNVGFIDSSPNYFPITRVGNTTQGTFSPFSVGAGQWGNYFIGTSDAISFPDNIAFTLTADFCVECWFYQVSSASGTLFSKWESSAQEIYISTDTSNRIRLGWGSFNQNASTTPLLLTANNAFSFNTWTHLAVVRSGNTFTMYINGVSAATATFSTGASDLGQPLYIGGYASTGFQFPGYISNARIVKGSPVYTAPFTPPTAPLTAIANTVLLTCQDNRFRDNSNNGFVATVRGTPRVTPFSPFAPTAAYSAGTNGGSGYFDGTGDYLTIANNDALNLSGVFTFECWFYLERTTGIQTIASKWVYETTAWLCDFSSSTFNFYLAQSGAADSINASWTATTGQWYHIAVTRDSSNNVRMFLNGVQIGSTITSTRTASSTSPVAICFNNSGVSGAGHLQGYVSNFRILKGTAVYTSNFTPPTAPLTAITNTSLLCNFTNAGILDQTGKNVLETVGNAQVDTNVKKYGTGSIKFDGTGDWLLLPHTVDHQLGTGNFTIEFWVIPTALTAAHYFVSKGTSTTGWAVWTTSGGQPRFDYANTSFSSNATLVVNNWYHIAVVRTGTGTNQTRIYVNGVQQGQGTVATDFIETTPMYIGANRVAASPFFGFIDDLRITKGVARYTANFTPPALAFPDK